MSSRLLRKEMSRVLRRTEQPLTRRSYLLDYVGTLPVDHAVLLGFDVHDPVTDDLRSR